MLCDYLLDKGPVFDLFSSTCQFCEYFLVTFQMFWFYPLRAYLEDASTLIIANLQKRNYTYTSLQFPTEINTSNSKTPTIYIPAHTDYDYRTRLL